ncbi:MAG: response regulator transcription factor [Eggerthellaceae bacterium]|nr:response regulator transcription factor [Eggerthellaceae bacterium]
MQDLPTRILLVDDQVLYREAMCGLIERWPEFEVVAEASDGAEAVEVALGVKPDLILMDVRMPKMDGIAAAQAIHDQLPEAAIVMLTVESDKDLVFNALQTGIRGYLLKDTPARKLRDRLHSIMEGEASLSESVTAAVMDEFTRLREETGAASAASESGDIPSPDHLTDREKDILRLVAQGKSNEEIARELYLSLGTVKKQLGNLMLRLCLENRVQAAVYAVKVGLDK